MAIGGFDQPFNLGAIQSLRRSALGWGFHTELAACLFDDMLGLMVGQVILTPELSRLSGDIVQEVRFLILTANFSAAGTGFARWHGSEYGEKFGVCSFCERPPLAHILIYMCSGGGDDSYADLQYVRRRCVTKEHLRSAIAQVCNAILRVRDAGIWA